MQKNMPLKDNYKQLYFINRRNLFHKSKPTITTSTPPFNNDYNNQSKNNLPSRSNRRIKYNLIKPQVRDFSSLILRTAKSAIFHILNYPIVANLLIKKFLQQGQIIILKTVKNLVYHNRKQPL